MPSFFYQLINRKLYLKKSLLRVNIKISAMSDPELEDRWKKIGEAVKQKYEKWFEDDKEFLNSGLQKYISKLRSKTGRTIKDIEQELRDWPENDNHL